MPDQPVIHILNPPPPWRCGCPTCLVRPPWDPATPGQPGPVYDISESLRRMREGIVTSRPRNAWSWDEWPRA
jgi:hypothetical protein